MTRGSRQIFAPHLRGAYQKRWHLMQRWVVGIHQPSDQHTGAAEARNFRATLSAVVHDGFEPPDGI